MSILPAPAILQCEYCKKEFSGPTRRKSLGDHRRGAHCFYYVSFPTGMFESQRPLSISIKLTFVSGEKHILERIRSNGHVSCHICRIQVVASCERIRLHYSARHKSQATVTIKYPTLSTSPPTPSPSDQNTQPPFSQNTQPPFSQNTQPDPARSARFLMEVDEPPQLDDLPGNVPDGDWLDDDGWETDSSSSTSIVDDHDEDPVVPSSFTLPASAHSPPEDDPSADEDEGDLSDAPDGEATLPPNRVYGSAGKHLSSPEISSPSLTSHSQGLQRCLQLSGLGFAVNVEANAIVCISCSRGVPVDMVRSHCKKHHPGRDLMSRSEAEKLAELNGGLRASTSERYTQPPGQKPLHGLEVLQGYVCPAIDSGGTVCSRAFLATSTFVRHLGTHHINPPVNPALCSSPVQTLFVQGNLQMYFAVDTTLSQPDPHPNLAYADALKLLRALPEPQIPTPKTDKDRESVHWFTRWPELMEPYCKTAAQVNKLRSLVAFPEARTDQAWLVRTRDHGCQWWDKAELAHAKCTSRASGLLKSTEGYVSCVPPLCLC